MKLAGCQKRGNKKKTPKTALKVRNRKYRSLHRAPSPDSWLCPLPPSLRSSTVEKRFAQIFHTKPLRLGGDPIQNGQAWGGGESGKSSHQAGCFCPLLRPSVKSDLVAEGPWVESGRSGLTPRSATPHLCVLGHVSFPLLTSCSSSVR